MDTTNPFFVYQFTDYKTPYWDNHTRPNFFKGYIKLV